MMLHSTNLSSLPSSKSTAASHQQKKHQQLKSHTLLTKSSVHTSNDNNNDNTLPCHTRLLQSLARNSAIAATTLSLALSSTPLPAEALLNSPNANIPRTAEVALRRSIPAFNEDVSKIQDEIERIQFKLRIPQRKPWNAMAQDAEDALRLASDDAILLKGVLPEDQSSGQGLAIGIRNDLERLNTAIKLKDADRTSIRAANVLERIASLELLQAPGLPYTLPLQYKTTRPYLTGRAIIDVVIENSKGKKVFFKKESEEGMSKRITIQLTLDGYAAPFTAGNFLYNVLHGVYNRTTVSVNPESIFGGNSSSVRSTITDAPSSSDSSSSSSSDNSTDNTNTDTSNDTTMVSNELPLEFLPAGDFEPIYRSTLSVREGELPTLPLSIYGAIAMSHLPGSDASSGYVSSQQFFLYKYERQSSGLAGLAFDEGQFPVLGYVTDGIDVLSQIRDGDVIVSMNVVKGKDKLVVPST